MAPSDALALEIPPGWTYRCVSLLPNVTNITEGLVDQYGGHTLWSKASTWGITYSLCQEYCSFASIPPVASLLAGDFFLPFPGNTILVSGLRTGIHELPPAVASFDGTATV
jgi:hypothetical protein